MPKNKRRGPFPAEYVEIIHDEMVATYWAFDEPIQPREFRDRRLLESAVNRPFQSAFGKDIHRTVLDKAAALFHSLITNHPFTNGNKRTAVIAADQFLLANGYLLVLNPGEMYRLARRTARHNELSIPPNAMLAEIRSQFQSHSLLIRNVRGSGELDDLRKTLLRLKKAVPRALIEPGAHAPTSE